MAAADFYVYVLFRETGIPFYVGKGRLRRLSRHRWTHPKVIIAQGLTDVQALAIEAAFIKAIGRPPLINKNNGGPGPVIFSDEARERMRQAALRNGAGKWNKGRKHTPEAIEQIRAASIARGSRPPYLHVGPPRPPRPKLKHGGQPGKRPPGTGAKISAALTGKKLSPEHRAKIVKNLVPGSKFGRSKRRDVPRDIGA